MSGTHPDSAPKRCEPWGDRADRRELAVVAIAVGVPFLALFTGIYLLWGTGISAVDLALTIVMYVITAHGISVGYHRLFTHQAFKATRPVRILLACLGTMAVEGDVVTWASDHRRHHQFSDNPGDPHSPWRFGTSTWALVKGLLWAHLWWMFRNERTDQRHYAPDLLDDHDISLVVRAQPLLVLTSLSAPALIGGVVTQSWWGAVTAFFWAGLVRVSLLHHVTWSINSLCHTLGDRPFRSRDRSGNVWWLAIASGGEAWHNYHHADPTSARHGVRRYQVDTSARLIWLMQKIGWAHHVRWPDQRRILALIVDRTPRR